MHFDADSAAAQKSRGAMQQSRAAPPARRPPTRPPLPLAGTWRGTLPSLADGCCANHPRQTSCRALQSRHHDIMS